MKKVTSEQPPEYLPCSYAPCMDYCARLHTIHIDKQAVEKMDTKMIYCREDRKTGKFDIFCSSECHEAEHKHKQKEDDVEWLE